MLFENFSENEYYQEIDFDTWRLGAGKFIDIDTNKVKELDNFFRDELNSKGKESGEYYTKGRIIRSYTIHNNNGYIIIHEFPDEYLYVVIDKNNTSKYYKCDQLDGLLKCLEDKLNY